MAQPFANSHFKSHAAEPRSSKQRMVLPSDEESNKVESQSDRKRAHWQESTSWHSLLGFRQAGRFSLLYAFPSAVVTAHSRFPNVNPAWPACSHSNSRCLESPPTAVENSPQQPQPPPPQCPPSPLVFPLLRLRDSPLDPSLPSLLPWGQGNPATVPHNFPGQPCRPCDICCPAPCTLSDYGTQSIQEI